MPVLRTVGVVRVVIGVPLGGVGHGKPSGFEAV
jgi:hypothetical protein